MKVLSGSLGLRKLELVIATLICYILMLHPALFS